MTHKKSRHCVQHFQYSRTYQQGYNFSPYASSGVGNFAFGSGSGYEDEDGSYQQVCNIIILKLQGFYILFYGQQILLWLMH